MNDVKLFVRNEEELETVIQIIRIYFQNRGMEFGIDKCTMFILKSGKKKQQKE